MLLLLRSSNGCAGGEAPPAYGPWPSPVRMATQHRLQPPADVRDGAAVQHAADARHGHGYE